MRRINKILIFAAAALLILVFFFPLWQISLGAPQYPEPLYMYIWINKITGDSEFTIQNINILNHYIGMAPIHPDSFKELSIMPWVLGGLIFLGFLTGLIGKKWALYSWVFLLIAAGAVGLWDFYHWETAFGTNLDPHAPIKLEGMTYSPPFIGKKVLLNIEAISLPATGGFILFSSILLALIATFIQLFGKKKTAQAKSYGWSKKHAFSAASLLFVALIGLTACSKGPQQIEYGVDACHFCKMTITDQRFGSELVTDKGKVFMFDAVECMAGYISRNGIESEKIHSLWVSDFSNPGELVEARQATFLQSSEMPSPMGMYLNAFKIDAAARELKDSKGGTLMDWEGVMDLVDSQAIR